jgi:hypothetical protein
MYWKLRQILTARGIPDPPPDSFRVEDNGAGQVLVLWTVAILGAQPTPAEIAAVSDGTATDTSITASAFVTSRQKDILATVAWALRLKDLAAWTALTTAQKKTAVLAAADDWRDIRVFIEKNI